MWMVSDLGICRSSGGHCMRSVSSSLGSSPCPTERLDGVPSQLTPSITDRTGGAYCRGPMERAEQAPPLPWERVEGVATHRHERWVEATRSSRSVSSSAIASVSATPHSCQHLGSHDYVLGRDDTPIWPESLQGKFLEDYVPAAHAAATGHGWSRGQVDRSRCP